MIVNHTGIVSHKGIVQHEGIIDHGGLFPVNDGVLFQDGTAARFQNGKRADFQGFQEGVAPEANAGANQTLADGSTITLDGTATTGTAPIAYAWTQVSGPSVTITNDDQATATVTGAPVGNYVFKLTATNDYGSSESTTDVEIEAAVGCSPNWEADPSAYSAIGVPYPDGTFNGPDYTWETSDPPQQASLLTEEFNTPVVNPEASPCVFECGFSYGGSAPSATTIASVVVANPTALGIGFPTASIQSSGAVLSLGIDSQSGSDLFALPSNDISQLSAISIETFGDGTCRANALYGGVKYSTATIGTGSLATSSGLGYLATDGWSPDDNITLTAHDSSNWLMTYPTNAQDMCGNTQ